MVDNWRAIWTSYLSQQYCQWAYGKQKRPYNGTRKEKKSCRVVYLDIGTSTYLEQKGNIFAFYLLPQMLLLMNGKTSSYRSYDSAVSSLTLFLIHSVTWNSKRSNEQDSMKWWNILLIIGMLSQKLFILKQLSWYILIYFWLLLLVKQLKRGMGNFFSTWGYHCAFWFKAPKKINRCNKR